MYTGLCIRSFCVPFACMDNHFSKWMNVCFNQPPTTIITREFYYTKCILKCMKRKVILLKSVLHRENQFFSQKNKTLEWHKTESLDAYWTHYFSTEIEIPKVLLSDTGVNILFQCMTLWRLASFFEKYFLHVCICYFCTIMDNGMLFY